MSNISLYQFARDTSSTVTISITDFLHGVKFGKWENDILAIRREPDKKIRQTLKEGLQCVTMSGAFNARRESGLIAHSGFICIDIDGYDDKTALLKDIYTYAIFKSASGNGLACLIKVDPNKHKDSFRFIQKHYFESYGIIVDPAPSNVASLRYVSFDPELEINEKSKISRAIPLPKHEPKSIPLVIGDDAVSQLIVAATQRGANLAPDYQSYLNLSFALAAGFGEGGRQWFHALCSMDGKYNSQHADRQYSIALARNNSGVTVGTLYWMLKKAGIELPNNTKKFVQVAAIAKSAGRTKEAVATQLIELHNVKPEQAQALADEVFSRSDIDLKSTANSPKNLIEAVMEWLSQNHPLKRNVITGAYESNGVELNKKELNAIYLRARLCFDTKDLTYDLIERIIFSTFTNDYNPITEYIDKNKYRKSTGNLDALCRTISSNTPYGEMFLKKWLIAIIAAYHGYPVRYVLAFVGQQNSGKTEWFRRLLPKELQKYYGESKLDRGKDDELLMCQKLMIMDDEMGGKSKQDEKLFKELTSKSIFSLRAPYGRGNEDFKRLAILCGTSNDTRIINDRTGNTRILTVEVDEIDHEGYNAIDKDELFMELYHMYEAGVEWRLDKEDLSNLANVSKEFEEVNTEAELITQFFLPADGNPGLTEKLTATQIKDYIENNSKQQIKGFKFFGMELKRIFGLPRQDNGLRYYLVIKKHQ